MPIGTNTAVNSSKLRATSFQSFGTAYGAKTCVSLWI